MSRFARWWKQARPRWWRGEPPAQPLAAPAPSIPMKISPEALTYANGSWTGLLTPVAASEPRHASSLRDVFKLPTPAPGVMPEDAFQGAMDDIGDVYNYAATQGWGEGLGFIGYPYLAELTQRPEYRRISETIAKEMTRKWIKIEVSGDKDKADKVEQLEEALDKHNVQDIFRKVAEQDGFFGRSHLFVDIGETGDDLATVLAISNGKIKKGGLKGLRVVEPIWSYPADYNAADPLAPDYYRPKRWYVQGVKIHRSRFLTFVSREMPDLLKPAYAFGGLSLTQMAIPYVQNWLRTRQSVSDLLHSFSIMILATNMASTLQGGAGQEILNRAQMAIAYRDNRGLQLIDKETEEFMNIAVPLGTLDALQAQSQEQMAAVSGIPLVKLLGIQPAGLNASSEGEIRVFYDWVHAQQEHLFARHLRTVIDVIQLSEFGDIDPEIGFSFEPLWQLDAAATASVKKTQADTHIELIDAGVISPEEVREVYAADETSDYNGIDLSGPPPEPQMDPANDPEMLADPAKAAEPKKLERSGV